MAQVTRSHQGGPARLTLGTAGNAGTGQSIRRKLEFWSEVGAGTEALLTVPAEVAYAESKRGSSSFLRRKGAGACMTADTKNR